VRGGFLLIDDLHGEYDWSIFEAAIRRVFPDRPIVEIPEDDPLMHVFFDLDEPYPHPRRTALTHVTRRTDRCANGRPAALARHIQRSP